jgi:hypothetical protein
MSFSEEHPSPNIHQLEQQLREKERENQQVSRNK